MIATDSPDSRGGLGESTELVLDGVYKKFGALEALRGISLAVGAGELLTLLGPSGSGKSTLLQTVAGYELPDAGTIILGASDITGLSPSKREIGMVFQSYALFPHMSVAENVGFSLEVRRMSRDEVRRRVTWALGLVEMADLGHRRPRELSGGQQQRVALARAIVFGPRLLLLDEPLGALDRKLRDAMQAELKRLQRRLKLTTLFITHDQEEALALGDRVAVLRQGRIEQVAAPHEIYARPANRFVAEFVGDSNLMTGTIVASEEDEVVLDCGADLRIVATRRHCIQTGARATLLLRPEVLQIAGSACRPRNIVRATVTQRDAVGSIDRYRLQAANGMEILWHVIAHPSRHGFACGAVVDVGWEAADGHLLVAD